MERFLQTRMLLAASVLCVALLGCSKSEPSPGLPGTAQPQVGQRIETGDGPPEKDLAKALDLPLYPGSTILKNKLTQNGDEHGYHVTLETQDRPDQVTAFYTAQGIPGAAKGDQGQSMGTTKHGNSVIIDVSRKAGHTEIAIMATTEAHG